MSRAEDEAVEPVRSRPQGVLLAIREVDDRVPRPHLAYRALLPEEARTAEREEDLLREPVRVRRRREAAGLDLHAVDGDPLRAGSVPEPLPGRRHRPLLAPDTLDLIPVRDHTASIRRQRARMQRLSPPQPTCAAAATCASP